jgi:hypothetical protein
MPISQMLKAEANRQGRAGAVLPSSELAADFVDSKDANVPVVVGLQHGVCCALGTAACSVQRGLLERFDCYCEN